MVEKQDKAKILPLKTVRVGGSIATIWENKAKNKSGDNISVFNISLERRYLDSEGEWQSTNTFNVNDIPKAILALNKAYEFLSLKEDREE